VYFWKVNEMLNVALVAFPFWITPCNVLLFLYFSSPRALSVTDSTFQYDMSSILYPK
jgi:hypothetical protein